MKYEVFIGFDIFSRHDRDVFHISLREKDSSIFDTIREKTKHTYVSMQMLDICEEHEFDTLEEASEFYDSILETRFLKKGQKGREQYATIHPGIGLIWEIPAIYVYDEESNTYKLDDDESYRHSGFEPGQKDVFIFRGPVTESDP